MFEAAGRKTTAPEAALYQAVRMRADWTNELRYPWRFRMENGGDEYTPGTGGPIVSTLEALRDMGWFM